MRWNKGDEYIELERATSVDGKGEVFVIVSSVPWAVLPVEFREQVPANGGAPAALRDAVASWAHSNGFKEATA